MKLCFAKEKGVIVTDKQKKRFDSWESARNAVKSLEEYGIKPEANHFAVWLAYHSKSHQTLCDDINHLIEKSKKIDEHVCSSLFERYLERAAISEKVLNAGTSVADEISDIMKDIGDVEKKTKAFNNQLADAKSALSAADNPQKVNSIVSSLESATKDMEENSRALESRLAQSRSEIDHLRKELEIVRSEAATDSLTGASNRKTFDIALKSAIRDSRKNRKPFSLIIADIDNFKRINDTWGHQTGDQVICFVAGVMMREMPEGGTVARLGGEEFALIAPNTDEMQARMLSERIRKIVENKKLIRRASKEDLGKITVSLGYGAHDKAIEAEDFIERIDEALYKAKNAGRNCSNPAAIAQKKAA